MFGSANYLIHDSIVITRGDFHTSARYILIIPLSLLFCFIQPLLAFILALQASSLQSHYTFTPLLSEVFLKKYKNIFLRPYVNYYDKMHYEELDLFSRCIRANISIKLHKTIYEIISTLLHKTHFKPPSSVGMWNLFVYCC